MGEGHFDHHVHRGQHARRRVLAACRELEMDWLALQKWVRGHSVSFDQPFDRIAKLRPCSLSNF